MGWIDAPTVQAALTIVVAAFLFTGAARLIWGKERGQRRAAIGAGLVIPIACFAIAKTPQFPPESSIDVILILAVTGFFFGAILDFGKIERWSRRAVTILATLAGLIWVVAEDFQSTFPQADRNLIVAIFIATTIATVRVSRVRGSAMTAPIHLAVAGIGFSLLAWLGGSVPLAQISAAVALATTGFLLWNWPIFRFPPSAALVIGAAVPLAAVAGALTISGAVSGAALAILVLIFFSDWLAGAISLGGGRLALATRPILVAAVGMLAVAGAAALATL